MNNTPFENIPCYSKMSIKFLINIEMPILNIQKGVYDEAMSSFFRNVDARYENPLDIPLGDQKGEIRTLKARVRMTCLA